MDSAFPDDVGGNVTVLFSRSVHNPPQSGQREQ
jgi:hypothetical protein